MRKLYQILYNVGRLTDAPGGGRFLSRGDTLAGAGFPFWGTLWRGQGCEKGKHSELRRPSALLALFPSWPRRCDALWNV